MKKKTRFLALSILSLALSGGLATDGAFAEGAGGLLFGLTMPAWNPDFMPDVPSSLPEFESMGGYGYGVSRDGVIVGGFGLAFLDYDIYTLENWSSTSKIPMHVAGGAGGLIVGSRIVGSRWTHLDVAARIGLGGMGLAKREIATDSAGADYYIYVPTGYAIAYIEPYVELGLSLTPWMRFCANLSYPILGNFIPGKPFAEVLYYSPALGFTVTFGSF